MKKFISIKIISLVLILFTGLNVHSQMIDINEATIIAKNWININIDQYGGWGESGTAEIEPLQELIRDGRKLGYFCFVKPAGFIVISLRKELVPIKAYSYTDSIDFGQNEGMPGLIKDWIEKSFQIIDNKVGIVESVKTEDLVKITDNREAYEEIFNYQPGRFEKKKLKKMNNYREGDFLLSSKWNQGAPYNNYCPDYNCSNTGNGKAWVGCVATAASQIMKYWSYPPFGDGPPYNDGYDWAHMDTVLTTDSSSSLVQAAVAELCYEVGVAAGMNWDCEGSWALTSDMIGVFKNDFYYSDDCSLYFRYFSTDWFDQIKGQINQNRPILYGIKLHDEIKFHAIVLDGWMETVVPQVHANYGWGGDNNTWFTLDSLDFGNILVETFVGDIVPKLHLGATLNSTYETFIGGLPRYFDRDAAGDNATFNGGQYLQTLPGITIKGTGNSNGVRFGASTTEHTYIYTHGDPTRGIRIGNGVIRLINNGSIKFNKLLWY